MNKHIRLLIENITDDIFNDDLFNTDDTYTTISNDIFCSYHPKTNEELRKLLGHLFVKRGKDADLNDIDVSNITDMSELFKDLDPHNIDIRYWDVSNVEDMNFMFSACTNFNCDLSGWDVRNVENMGWMFRRCTKFDCNLSGWDVSNVEDMSYMFDNCKKLTGKGLENWKPIKCNNMGHMFIGCTNFDCNLSGWDVSNVKNMRFMFFNCTKFRGKGLNEWKPIKCEYMGHMFDKCNSLNSYPIWYKK